MSQELMEIELNHLRCLMLDKFISLVTRSETTLGLTPSKLKEQSIHSFINHSTDRIRFSPRNQANSNRQSRTAATRKSRAKESAHSGEQLNPAQGVHCPGGPARASLNSTISPLLPTKIFTFSARAPIRPV